MKHRQTHTVEVEHNGTRHRGKYTVESGVVEVSYGMATTQTLICNSQAIFVARRLLLEILDGNN